LNESSTDTEGEEATPLLPPESNSKLFSPKFVEINDIKIAFLALKVRVPTQVNKQISQAEPFPVNLPTAFEVKTTRTEVATTQVKEETEILAPKPKAHRSQIARPKEGWDNIEYRFKFGYTPWPEFQHPTPETAADVFEILRADLAKQGVIVGPGEKGSDSKGPAHGTVTSVTVDAIVRTILSQATNNENAIFVQELMKKRYTYTVDGEQVKGELPNYHSVRLSSHEELANIIKPAGCHNIRAKYIKAALDKVYHTNWASLSSKDGVDTGNTANASDFVPGLLSLGFLEGKSKVEVMNWFLGLEGIGLKTACCILDFNYGFHVCAVDTHVWTMAKWLGWLPPECDTANAACMHLDALLPDHLKHDLHQAFWHHRQKARCPACKGSEQDAVKEEDAAKCPLNKLLIRTRVKKRSERKVVVKVEESEIKVASPKPLRSKVPYHELEPEKAAGLGYVEDWLPMNDDFAAGSVNKSLKRTWVLQK
jgi:endonuclease III